MSLSRYRVYTDPQNFVLIEADSALVALKNSGVPEAFRIERDSLHLNSVLKMEVLLNTANDKAPAAAPASPIATAPATPATVAAAENPPAPAAPEAPPAAAPAPAESAPLSSTDVDKLLNS